MRHSSRSTRVFGMNIPRQAKSALALALALACYSCSLLFFQPSPESFDGPCPGAATWNYLYSPLSSEDEKHQQVADLDFLCHDPAISFLKVLADDPPPQSQRLRPKILCLILTQESSHATRLDAILETWGQKCDRIVAASDKDDPSRHAYHIQSETGYWGIWDKLMQSLRMIVLEQQLEFDWILKADDDTYVIMENLRSFLSNTSSSNIKDDVPLIYGRTMPWPRLVELKTFGGWFETPNDKAFRDRFYAKFPDKKQRLVYAHGGPGYVMNSMYVQALIRAYFHSPSVDAVHGRVSEDLANAVTMLYNFNVTPQTTMDLVEQKERSHPESPRTMYDNPKWLPWVQENIQNRGDGPACCSSSSISYHHVNHREMRLLHYQLYQCPERR
jgi:glycoprotein-N-acetylgalactosamine 3-beta-galactosyltransferase